MRTRFAPSPTGLLHVGGLRTALYAWLLSRQQNGTFILRIEDTDQEREVPGAVQNIVESLRWAGLTIDEGVTLCDGVLTEMGSHGPYTQSKRLDMYKLHAESLLASGHAYRCFCTQERLESMRAAQIAAKRAPMYDRACLRLSSEEIEKNLAAGVPSVLRLRVPDGRTVLAQDLVRGDLSFACSTIDDQVLMKSDGFPTYHLANVVDDHLMGIDLVLRGEEWLSSLPKHLLLYEAFGWTPPEFAHVSLLLNADKSKLSKRQNAVSVQEYRDRGYLPEALTNFLALLGWNPGTTQELFSLEELQESFSVDRIQKAGAIFDCKKLDWLQGHWMRRLPDQEFIARMRSAVGESLPEALEDPSFAERALLVRDRITFFTEGQDMLSFFYRDPAVTIDLLANAKQKVTVALLPKILSTLYALLSATDAPAWTNDHLFTLLSAEAKNHEWSLGQILWPLRALLTGRPFSPSATELAAALGKETTLKRIAHALSMVQSAP